MVYGKIIAVGCCLPKKNIINEDLSTIINTNDEWIVKRTGIKQRYVVNNKNETTCMMGFYAAINALKKANIKSSSIDMIIVATTTPDYVFPSTACTIQKLLKTNNCPAFDIQVACSGFIYALSIANSYIKSHSFKRILVIGTESMSKTVDWTDRTTCILFGDGAAAIVLEASDHPGIIAINIHANGSLGDYLYLNKNNSSFVNMDGKKIFKLAINFLNKSCNNILKTSNLNIHDIDWIISHQANIRIIQALAKSLNISIRKFIITIDKHANTSSASIPLALYYGIKCNKIKSDQVLLINAFGAGLTWGSAVMIY